MGDPTNISRRWYLPQQLWCKCLKAQIPAVPTPAVSSCNKKSSPDESSCWISWHLAFEAFVILRPLCCWQLVSSADPMSHRDVSTGLSGRHRQLCFGGWLRRLIISIELKSFEYLLYLGSYCSDGRFGEEIDKSGMVLLLMELTISKKYSWNLYFSPTFSI